MILFRLLVRMYLRVYFVSILLPLFPFWFCAYLLLKSPLDSPTIPFLGLIGLAVILLAIMFYLSKLSEHKDRMHAIYFATLCDSPTAYSYKDLPPYTSALNAFWIKDVDGLLALREKYFD